MYREMIMSNRLQLVHILFSTLRVQLISDINDELNNPRLLNNNLEVAHVKAAAGSIGRRPSLGD